MENKIEDILKGLNPAQKEAVEAIEGPILIVAGAGSGKTTVLTSRLAYMLASGVQPSSVLALTFTNKAANEMKERVANKVGAKQARRVVMGTFHSVFLRFLREYAGSLGYTPGFTIYDSSDSQAAIRACIKQLELNDKEYQPRRVLSRISDAKNNLVLPEMYANRPDIIQKDIDAKLPRISALYKLYQEKLKAANVMDFDDILVNMSILLRDNKEALQDLASRFSYIMVDEYQDTNFAQYNIIRKLTLLHNNICVVGDDSQSIYAFRGARVQNILNFQKDFPQCRIIKLELNYRSTKTIVEAANSVIAKNENRIPKDCYSQSEQGEKIVLKSYGDDKDEAAGICAEILSRKNKEGASYDDFAILYRTNSQSRALEEVLKRRNVPYKIYSGNSFFDREEVKDMMAYFKLAVNIDDDESFKRICNKPARGIGDTSVKVLTAAAAAHKLSLFRTLACEDLEAYGLKSAGILRLREFGKMIDGFAARALDADAYTIAKDICNESGYYAFAKADKEKEGRLENVEELINSVGTYVEDRKYEAAQNGEEATEIALFNYLENITLLTTGDDEDEDKTDKVALMTVHAAKGLEFAHVIVAGMENNVFPSSSSMAGPELEEERRLFYVALTRAKKTVFLTHCDTRFRNGQYQNNSLSVFVKEIAPQYLDDVDGSKPHFGMSYGTSSPVQYQKRPSGTFPYGRRDAYAPKPAAAPKPVARPVMPAPPPVQLNFTPDPMEVFRVGQIVEHNRFGKGRIVSLTGVFPELRAMVDFESQGTKTLLLKYAKMRVVKE